MYKLNPFYKGRKLTILDIQCTEGAYGFVLQNLKNTISVTNIDKYYVSIEDVICFTQRDGTTLCAPHFREQLRFEFLHRLKKKDVHLKENDRHTVVY